jgi:5-methylcytosine-specific restriction enzyme subunit McrC
MAWAQPLVEFSRIVLANATVSPAAGSMNTFSLLFPMEQVFEEFIGHFVRRHSSSLGISRQAIHIQANARGKWLLKTEQGAGRFRLRPDVVVDESSSHPRFIVDTKWKRLKTDAEDAKNGVVQSDLYQLYAYAHRYNSSLNVLLYPHVPGVTNKTYQLAMTRTDDYCVLHLSI